MRLSEALADYAKYNQDDMKCLSQSSAGDNLEILKMILFQASQNEFSEQYHSEIMQALNHYQTVLLAIKYFVLSAIY